MRLSAEEFEKLARYGVYPCSPVWYQRHDDHRGNARRWFTRDNRLVSAGFRLVRGAQ
jgi:hypothetical protein